MCVGAGVGRRAVRRNPRPPRPSPRARLVERGAAAVRVEQQPGALRLDDVGREVLRRGRRRPSPHAPRNFLSSKRLNPRAVGFEEGRAGGRRGGRGARPEICVGQRQESVVSCSEAICSEFGRVKDREWIDQVNLSVSVRNIDRRERSLGERDAHRRKRVGARETGERMGDVGEREGGDRDKVRNRQMDSDS